MISVYFIRVICVVSSDVDQALQSRGVVKLGVVTGMGRLIAEGGFVSHGMCIGLTVEVLARGLVAIED